MPGTKGNLNAARNGTRLEVRRLTVGEFPKPLNSVKIEGRKYRRALEDAVLDVHGEVSISAAHLIDTAAGAIVHAGICRWLLRNRIGDMTTADVLACSGQLLRSKESRDRAVKQLDLNRNGAPGGWTQYYDQPPKGSGPATDETEAKGDQT